jgi:glutathione S-transferase
MKLYYSKGACSLVVRIVIHEIGLKTEFEAVDLKNKKTEKGQDFFTINAKGSVPTLELDNGEILTENAVILQYLADTSKANQLLPFLGDFKRYRVLEWVNYITTELHKGFSPLFNPSVPQDVKDKVFIPLIKNKFSAINAHLQQNHYLLGDDFSLSDPYLYVILRWAVAFKIDLKEYTHLTRYFNNLHERASIQQALKEEGLK